MKKKIQDLSFLSPELKNLVEKSRNNSDFGGGDAPLAEDDEGNIYELVWSVPPRHYAKGITTIVWDSKTLPEGVKVIKWKKVK